MANRPCRPASSSCRRISDGYAIRRVKSARSKSIGASWKTTSFRIWRISEMRMVSIRRFPPSDHHSNLPKSDVAHGRKLW
ncbi:hypothetical protein ELH65_34680 [Rhizobium ruizarguesonis]|nr:hypothetical protein ELH65_34680 [Rhizobium ruizarguesonis]